MWNDTIATKNVKLKCWWKELVCVCDAWARRERKHDDDYGGDVNNDWWRLDFFGICFVCSVISVLKSNDICLISVFFGVIHSVQRKTRKREREITLSETFFSLSALEDSFFLFVFFHFFVYFKSFFFSRFFFSLLLLFLIFFCSRLFFIHKKIKENWKHHIITYCNANASESVCSKKGTSEKKFGIYWDSRTYTKMDNVSDDGKKFFNTNKRNALSKMCGTEAEQNC